jgi:hypothetical protein
MAGLGAAGGLHAPGGNSNDAASQRRRLRAGRRLHDGQQGVRQVEGSCCSVTQRPQRICSLL